MRFVSRLYAAVVYLAEAVAVLILAYYSRFISRFRLWIISHYNIWRRCISRSKYLNFVLI